LRHNDKFEKRGLSVEVRNNDINFALRKFKKKVAEDGILQELRNREFYEKPSEVRAKAKKAGRARWLKKLEKMNEGIPTGKHKNPKR
jgi:small subunit ribosomal protein S21|tara:strand:- start:561 stop:821 length:261 start_codon:yes stop_codon:yes gene_type:complete